jgi:nicotinate phosphoribosyltransferase
VYETETLEAIRDRAQGELAKLHPGMRRLMNPHEYPVGLELELNALRNRMIDAARNLD